jgi:hypothetical protein
MNVDTALAVLGFLRDIQSKICQRYADEHGANLNDMVHIIGTDGAIDITACWHHFSTVFKQNMCEPLRGEGIVDLHTIEEISTIAIAMARFNTLGEDDRTHVLNNAAPGIYYQLHNRTNDPIAFMIDRLDTAGALIWANLLININACMKMVGKSDIDGITRRRLISVSTESQVSTTNQVANDRSSLIHPMPPKNTPATPTFVPCVSTFTMRPGELTDIDLIEDDDAFSTYTSGRPGVYSLVCEEAFNDDLGGFDFEL